MYLYLIICGSVLSTVGNIK